MRKILLSVFVCSSLGVCGQGILNSRLQLTEQDSTLVKVLEGIQDKSTARFYFLDEWLAPVVVPQRYNGQTLGQALEDVLRNTGISYVEMYPDVIVFVKDASLAILRDQALEHAQRANKRIARYEFGSQRRMQSSSVRISGRVEDSRTGEPLPHANIRASDERFGATTDENGNYVLAIPPGVYVLDFSLVDYEDQVVDVAAYADGTIDVVMDEMPTMLGEVVIQDQRNAELATARIGETQLVMHDVVRAPALLGEPDLIRQVQTLPGVTTVGESASGFNVRGGSVDQNLILYDGLPVFNSSHVFGFLSTFTPHAISDVSFYRGGIPAEYGGRVSSVLDIHAREGDMRKWNTEAGIGMITSNLMIDGPLTTDKTSMALSVRSTYSNWLIHAVRTDYADLRNSSVFFYDGSLKLTHVVDDRTRLSLTTYSSHDAFRLVGDSTYRWNNFLMSAKLERTFSSSVRGEIVAGNSTYGHSVADDSYFTASELSYRISAWHLKAAIRYQRGSHDFHAGWQQVLYRFHPGTLKPTSMGSNARHFSLDIQNSMESAAYLSDAWSPAEDVVVDAGLRVPLFVSFGPAWIYRYADAPREEANITDSLYVGWNHSVKTYAGVEPRLSVRWMTGPTASLKLGYDRMYQFLHLVTNTTAVTPVDIWQPSGYYFKPQHVDEISLGYFRDFRDRAYGLSAEIFYKAFQNILDFRDGAPLILNKHLETALLQGTGRAYGVETSLAKNIGRLTGTLNYTYSRAFRRISGPSSAESINGGMEYPANYDQPHIVNVSWIYRLSNLYSLTGDFTYHSGRPVTIPLSAFKFENTTVAYFSGRNQYRIPDYHRLDVALVIEGSNRRGRRAHGTWVISVYNVYGRRNPYSVFFKSSSSGMPKPYELAIIGTVLPSISYNVKF